MSSTTETSRAKVDNGDGASAPAIVQEEELVGLPRDVVPEEGTGTKVAYDLMTNELLLDGSARLNLATFVTTWMPPDAARLMAETADKNMIDKDEYPQTAEFERRCVNMIGRLWHAPGAGDVTGCSTTGSSEAAMLGGLALKWLWRERSGRRASRLTDPTWCSASTCKCVGTSSVAIGTSSRDSCRWRAIASISPPKRRCLTVTRTRSAWWRFWARRSTAATSRWARSRCPGRVGDRRRPGYSGARGRGVGRVRRAVLQPDLVWDFALPRVHSINASGHKYGLVYPGVGWAIWRDEAALPRDLVFDVNYLGGSMPTFALNFSRPGSEVLAQYFMLLALGRKGYEEIQRASNRIARHIANAIAAIGPYRLITDGSELPVVAFTLAPEVTNYTVFDVSARLRENGWLVPAYRFPENREDLSVLRVVVRAGLTNDMADLFLADMRKQTALLESLDSPLPDRRPEERHSFKH